MKTQYTVTEDGRTLIATRSFAAPLELVWHAWTDGAVLDRWWGPSPYKAVTQSYSFTEGGEWRYYMEGPDGDKHYCVNTYTAIDPHKQFGAEDAFCNEDGSINEALPKSLWQVTFTYVDGVTTVLVNTIYATPEELAQVVQMGMKEGFDQGLNQLEALLKN